MLLFLGAFTLRTMPPAVSLTDMATEPGNVQPSQAAPTQGSIVEIPGAYLMLGAGQWTDVRARSSVLMSSTPVGSCSSR